VRYELKSWSSKVLQCFFGFVYVWVFCLCLIYVVFVGIDIWTLQLTNSIQAIFTFVKALNINVDFKCLQMIESFSISFFSPFLCSFLLLLLLLFCFCLFFDAIVFFFLFGSVVQVHSHYNSCIKILFQFLRLTLHSAPVLFRRSGVFWWVLRLIIVSTNHGLMEDHCYTHR